MSSEVVVATSQSFLGECSSSVPFCFPCVRLCRKKLKFLSDWYTHPGYSQTYICLRFEFGRGRVIFVMFGDLRGLLIMWLHFPGDVSVERKLLVDSSVVELLVSAVTMGATSFGVFFDCRSDELLSFSAFFPSTKHQSE